ncbi:MAG TPA: hypothetical protein DCL41_07830 [Bdellovibrionales bacterium]|nr:hypothetical protein [Pseudobdellovibrionaceae bacterium]HAG91765.1 hypothetical protein [Bdellovibrionales bacterium]
MRFVLSVLILFEVFAFSNAWGFGSAPPSSSRSNYRSSTFQPSSFSPSLGGSSSLVGTYGGRSCERSNDPKLCMMCNCMRESAHEPLEGKILVGEVVQTRVRDTRWPDDICSVIYQHAQFSWTLKARTRRPLPRTNSRSMQECAIATARTINSPGNGMDHYHADYVTPAWARTCQRVKKVGRHIFYDHCGSERGPHRRYRRGKVKRSWGTK